MPVAIYCRVSTEAQETEGTSLKTQLEACLAYCKTKGYRVHSQFVETFSGLTLDRPQLTELRRLVRNGEVSNVVVYCIDRISRDPTQGVILFEELEKAGVVLEAVTETVETSDLGKLNSYIRGFAAKLEAAKIKERCQRGKADMLARGVHPTSQGKLYGYRWDKPTKKRLVVEYEAEVVKKVYAAAAAGQAINAITRDLDAHQVPPPGGKTWWQSCIRRMLANPAYMGITRYKDTELPGVTPAIISREIWDTVQAQLQTHQPCARAQYDYWLRGFVYCPCGHRMCGTSIRGGYRYYMCNSTRKAIPGRPGCKPVRFNANKLETLVWSKVSEVLAHPEDLIKEIRKQAKELREGGPDAGAAGRELTRLNNQVKGLHNHRENLLSLLKHERARTVLEADDVNTVLDNMERIKKEIEEAEARVRELQEMAAKASQYAAAAAGIKEFCKKVRPPDLANCTSEQKRQAMAALSVSVVVTKEQVKIHGVLIDEGLTISEEAQPSSGQLVPGSRSLAGWERPVPNCGLPTARARAPPGPRYPADPRYSSREGRWLHPLQPLPVGPRYPLPPRSVSVRSPPSSA